MKLIIAIEEKPAMYRRLITVMCEFIERMPFRCQWSFKILFGRGAGYIGGRTFYLAYNSGSRRDALRFRGRKFIPIIQIGFTKNANKVPWLSH